MSPFDQNIDNDAGHAIDQDDLIAFHLHELSPPQERALHRVLQTNPALQSESLAIATTLRAFPKHEAALPLDAAARERHWLALRPSLTAYIPPAAAPLSLFQSVFQRWALPTLAGAVLATTALLVAWHYTRSGQPATTATLSATTPTITPPKASQPNQPTNSQSNPVNPLPLTPHRAWPSTSAPLETATANPAPSIFPVQAPAPLTPTSPSTPAAEAASTAAIPLSPSNPVPAQPPTPPVIRSGKSPRTSLFHHSPTTELTLAIFGDIAASRSSTYTTGSGTSLVPESLLQAPTPAVGALASVRQQFSPWLGYRVTATYTRPTFIDTYKPSNSSNALGTYGGFNLTRTIYEFSGTYVVQGPHHRRLTTSAEAGAGMLSISSADTTDYPVTHTHDLRPTAVIGVGTELALTRHWGVRAEYRALLYKPPAFDSTVGGSIPVGALIFSSNPILGITYRFGANGVD